MNKVKFKEEQSFRAIGILGLLAVLIIGLSARFADHLFGSTVVEYNNLPILLMSWAVLIIAFIYFWKIRYTIKVNKKGISYQYFPAHSSKNKIKWEEVDNCEVVRTPLATELSGWNVQFSNEKNYSLSGRNGLNLTLKNGEQVFLGAKNLDKLQQVIRKFIQKES